MKTITVLFVTAAWVFSAIPAGDTVTNSMGLKFKRIPAGTFEMGFEGRMLTGPAVYNDMGRTITHGFYNESPKHKVTLTQDFYMGLYEVTNAQFKLFRPEHGYSYYNGNPNVPVHRLTWFEADSFCKWLTDNDTHGWIYRLPTEAEWEYCCRAGTTTWYSTGDTLSSTDAAGLGGAEIGDIGRFPANPFGLYDMHGNAQEWCQDWVAQYPPDSLVNPGGPDTGTIKAIRSLSTPFIFARTVARGGLPPVTDLYDHWTGFRVVISNLTKDSLHFYSNADTQPYQKRITQGRPVPQTLVDGETYVNSEGLAFKRVRMGRTGYPMQMDSVVYVSQSPVSGDSGTNRSKAGLFAKRLSGTYGVLCRLSNRYEIAFAGMAPTTGFYLTILPDIRYNTGAPHPDAAHFQFRETAFIPVPSPLVGGPVYYQVNHNSYIGEAPNGDIINAWYSSLVEDCREQVTAGSRLRLGENAWDSTASQIGDFPYDVDYGDIFRNDGRGVLQNYHFTWNATWLRKSVDNGVTWLPWRNCFAEIAGKSMFRLGGDTLMDITDVGGKLMLSPDNGETWRNIGQGAAGGYHSSGTVLDNGDIIVFQRGATVDNDSGIPTMLKATSQNLGQSWVASATPFIPPLTGQYDVCLKLQSGRLLMATKKETWTPDLNIYLCLAESEDSGKSWFCRRTLTMDIGGGWGYKSLCQGRDGVIHLQGTEGSDAGLNGTLPQASFTEQWLREGNCVDVALWGINTTGTVADCPDEDTIYSGLTYGTGEDLSSPIQLAAVPNPFNPVTTVRFGLPAGVSADYVLYDIRGKRMFSQSLLQSQSPRMREVVLDFNPSNGRGFASGTYFGRLICSDGKRYVHSLVMVR